MRQCSALVSVQIEIAVVCQVADRIFITNCVIGNGQSIGIVKGIGNSHLQISRIMFLAVRTLCGESNAVPAAFRLPDTPAQAAVTAVQMVFSFVAVQLYLLSLIKTHVWIATVGQKWLQQKRVLAIIMQQSICEI